MDQQRDDAMPHALGGPGSANRHKAPLVSPVDRRQQAFAAILFLGAWLFSSDADSGGPYARAYLDAGSASMIWQAIAASLVAAIVVLKNFGGQIKLTVLRAFGRAPGDSDPGADPKEAAAPEADGRDDHERDEQRAV